MTTTARPSLRSNVEAPAEPTAGDQRAAAIARALASPAGDAVDDVPHETVSFHLPVDLIEAIRELAEARLRIARRAKRQAKRQGIKGPDARRSSSAIVREALAAYRAQIEAETRLLTEKKS